MDGPAHEFKTAPDNELRVGRHGAARVLQTYQFF
jgi:hypothetical protein